MSTRVVESHTEKYLKQTVSAIHENVRAFEDDGWHVHQIALDFQPGQYGHMCTGFVVFRRSVKLS